MMTTKLIPYLVMNGNARAAINFYKEALEAEVLGIITFGDMPQHPDFPLPSEAKDLVSHATLKVGDSELMFSDTFPGQPHQIGNQTTICYSTNDIEKAKQVYDSLQQEGHIGMPLQETSFSPAYGIITDKFGVTFQIYTENH